MNTDKNNTQLPQSSVSDSTGCENDELLAKIRMKNKGWFPALKEFYEPIDVIRYYNEVDRINKRVSEQIAIHPPEKFFTEDVLKDGLKLLNIEKIKRLKERINYLKYKEITELEDEINALSQQI
jgi:hypothetical protein